MSWHATRFAAKIQRMVGRRFGRWLVVDFASRSPMAKGYNYRWLCRCDCGTERNVPESNLKNGFTKSCGCANQLTGTPKRRTHGMTGTKEHRAWQHMIGRCARETVEKYHCYGGRGIKVCNRWKDSFANFLADMGKAPSARHSIDRIDNDGDYCPGNCRWATQKQQMRNTRINHFLEFNGQRKTLAEWGEVTGISHFRIHERISRLGWSVEEALTIRPVRGFKRSHGRRATNEVPAPT